MNQVFLIKLSGEAMSGKLGSGLDFEYIEKICIKIKSNIKITNEHYFIRYFISISLNIS